MATTITGIRLQQFRSYKDASFEFEPGVNIIVGPNASGKTNLLEALFIIARGKSFKTSADNSIMHGQQWSRIDSSGSDNKMRVMKLTEQPKGVQRAYSIDDKKITDSEPGAYYPVVLFEPNHLYQITTSPEMRRNFIDSIIEQLHPQFAELRNNYTRALRQRNVLLKQPKASAQQNIFVWDVRLSELAGAYFSRRLQILEQINSRVNDAYNRLAPTTHNLELGYESKIKLADYANDMLAQLEARFELDQIRGYTSVGVHRDDLMLKIDSKDMRGVASRGETRSILLALKVIEAQLIEEKLHTKPLFLLDDVFGELDGARRKALVGFLKGHQTFITTTDADIVGHNFTSKSHIVML